MSGRELNAPITEDLGMADDDRRRRRENSNQDYAAARLPRLSTLDEQRFGVRTARVEDVKSEAVPGILQFCSREAVQLLIARCSVEQVAAAQAMEEAGFRLMDTLVYYQCTLRDPRASPDGLVRPLNRREEAEVEAIAKASFSNYVGHYHADPRLDPALSDETYVDWTRRCMSGEAADAVLVVEDNGLVAGFAALRMVSPELGDLVLGAVAPAARGRGFYRMLALAGMEWCQKNGAKQMTTSTHISNFAAQKAWTRAGMSLIRAAHTFHKWFQ
jgi:ribosomal protein S18 acetylase RimI-like enzyme